MKWVLLPLIGLITFIPFKSLTAQQSPVKWQFEWSLNDQNQYLVTATASIEDKWYVYSNHIEEGGPIPTSFTFDENIQTIGEVIETSEKISSYDELFEMELIRYKNEGVFSQAVIPAKGGKMISGYLTFMTCDGDRCLPPSKVPFSLSIKQ